MSKQQTRNLSRGAQFLLSQVQKEGPISRQAENRLGEAAQASETKPLSAQQVEKILLDAMPEQKAQVAAAKQAVTRTIYHKCDDEGDFVTHMVGRHRIKKERAEVYQQPAIFRPLRDPLFAKFMMDDEAKAMLLFNARDVDENGQPLLMKVVVREGTSVAALDLEQYRTRWKKPDIVKVAKDAAFVEIKDVQEREFAFGDPLLQVSLGKGQKELSRSVHVRPKNELEVKAYWGMTDARGRTVPNLSNLAMVRPKRSGGLLDDTPVRTFDDRVELALEPRKSLPQGSWLDACAKHVDLKLRVDPGLIFEPDANAEVVCLGAKIKTSVPSDDAFLLGSPSGEAKMKPSAESTLRQILETPLRVTTQTGGGSSDFEQTVDKLWQFVFGDRDLISVAGQTLKPLKSTRFKKQEQLKKAGITAELRPRAGDKEKDGARLTLKLPKGFLSADEGASVKGWTIAVGIKNADNTWQECKPRKLKGRASSGMESFSLDLENAPKAMAKNRSVEIRLYNAEGVPAQRVLIPLQKIPWGKACSHTTQQAAA